MKCVACNRNESGIRFGCQDCVNRTVRQLREIGAYWHLLPAMVEPLCAGGGRGAPGYASRTPARDDVLVALDPRAYPGGEPTTLHPDRETSWVRSIPLAIDGLSEALADERGHTGQPGAWGLGYVISAVQWCSEQHWFDELVDDIAELHAQCRALAHDVPDSLGACLEVLCGGFVFWRNAWRGQQRVSVARCAACSREYEGLDLVRLGVAQEAAA
ncbi:hypothetical protein [Amycolatopsis taiwanensis]|uniref:hypothetical protein n=1 Tax=Amycolatopsis taiwanensis TaxID=342230 RepID=UPI000484D59F|nr:hypothetical protein [Amycolatopsis taiwanensis]